MKYEPVVGQIEQALYAGHFDWESCPEPSGVRAYITRALLGMIEVIAEVSSKHLYVVCLIAFGSLAQKLIFRYHSGNRGFGEFSIYSNDARRGKRVRRVNSSVLLCP